MVPFCATIIRDAGTFYARCSAGWRFGAHVLVVVVAIVVADVAIGAYAKS